jgi:hypothetical protein
MLLIAEACGIRALAVHANRILPLIVQLWNEALDF